MEKIGIKNFTSPATGKTIPVNCAGIIAVLPYSKDLGAGPSYTEAKSVLMTGHGFALPVTENFDNASALWLEGLESVSGNA